VRTQTILGCSENYEYRQNFRGFIRSGERQKKRFGIEEVVIGANAACRGFPDRARLAHNVAIHCWNAMPLRKLGSLE
jgi:hypothetical protein